MNSVSKVLSSRTAFYYVALTLGLEGLFDLVKIKQYFQLYLERTKERGLYGYEKSESY